MVLPSRPFRSDEEIPLGSQVSFLACPQHRRFTNYLHGVHPAVSLVAGLLLFLAHEPDDAEASLPEYLENLVVIGKLAVLAVYGTETSGSQDPSFTEMVCLPLVEESSSHIFLGPAHAEAMIKLALQISLAKRTRRGFVDFSLKYVSRYILAAAAFSTVRIVGDGGSIAFSWIVVKPGSAIADTVSGRLW